MTRAGSFHPFSGRGHRGRLIPRANTDCEATATVSARAGSDSEKGRLGTLSLVTARIKPQWAEKQYKARASSIPTGTGSACRGGTGAPFDPKTV